MLLAAVVYLFAGLLIFAVGARDNWAVASCLEVAVMFVATVLLWPFLILMYLLWGRDA